MKKNSAFRRAAALMAALSITVSLAAPAFADIYYIDDGDITITKDEHGQTVQQNGTTKDDSGEIIITTREQTITTQESDLEGPAAEDTGFGPVVEDNYQPAPPAQPEDAEEPKDADQPESTEEPKAADQQEDAEESEDDDRQESAKESKDDDQKNAEESENDEEQKDADRQENTDQQESADRQAQPQQAAPAAAAASAPGFCDHIITVINKAATALKLTLKDVKIDVSDTGNYSADGKAALSVQGEGNVEIELDGDNVLKSGYDRAGLEKNTSKGTLTLKDDKEAGSGSLKAEGGDCGAGIGGGSGGSGSGGSGKNITITGGSVTAFGGDCGAGIGGGDGGAAENITITGGTVTAAGGYYGAGIGGGSGGSGSGGSGKNITITGGTVNAAGGWGGAGIGGGGWISGNGGWVSGQNITITGGTVNADGGDCGAGIGGGKENSGSNVTVSGAAQVTATAGKSNGYYGAGATIGSGGNETGGQPVDGDEIRADIRGVTTGYIHHIIYNDDGTIKREWWEPERPQPKPESPQPNPEDPNAPAEESNEVDLGTPLLHVETLEGSLLPFDARRQGSTLRVTSNTLAARLHGTRQALEALREQGVEQIQFVTTLKTTTLPVEDLLAEGGSWFALEHDGLVSRQLSAAQAESLKCWMR